MNPKNKKVLAGAAVAGVLVTWIPQLVAAGDDAPPPAPLGAAVPGVLVVESGVSPTEVAANAADASTATAGGSTNTSAGAATTMDPAEALEKRLGAVKAFLPERTQRDLDVLAAAWSLEIEEKRPRPDKESPDSVENARPPVVVVPFDEGPAAVNAPKHDAPPAVDPLDAFLAANPLTGVLFGDDLRFANLGASVVREGDDVFGIARVEAIGPRWIVLERGSRHVRVDLVPLTARAKVAATGSGSGSGTTGTTGGTSGPPGVTATPPTTSGTSKPAGDGNTSAQDLEALLSGMQKALGTLGAATAGDAKTSTTDEKVKKP